ncbi:hypothetical protein BC567DRAFT_297842 [Phyllosticta citribraziliensis]
MEFENPLKMVYPPKPNPPISPYVRGPLRPSECSQRFLTFVVGPNQKKFAIHRDIICGSSRFFDIAFNHGHFKESQTKRMALEDTDENVFRVVLDWMYAPEQQMLKRYPLEAYRTDDQGNKVEKWWDYLLSSCYIFSVVYDIPKLADDIMRLFQARFGIWNTAKCPSIFTILRVFDNVPEDSALSKLLIEKFAEHWNPTTAQNPIEKRGALEDLRHFIEFVQGPFISNMSQIPPDASDGEQLMVSFKVGPNQKQFLIHMDVVCQHSPVFDKALKSEFKEGKEREITL